MLTPKLFPLMAGVPAARALPALLLGVVLLCGPACGDRPVVFVPDPDGPVPRLDGTQRPDLGRPDLPPRQPDSRPDQFRSDLVGPSQPCADRSAQNPNGRPLVTFHRARGGLWQVALEQSGSHTDLVLPASAAGLFAASLDHVTDDVAGFVVARPGLSAGVQQDWTGALDLLQDTLGLAGDKVQVRGSGSQSPAHDTYPAVKGTTLDVTLKVGRSPSELRDLLTASLLGLPLSAIGNRPAIYGSPSFDLTVRLTVVRRYPLRTSPSTGQPLVDAAGHGLDSGGSGFRGVVVVGAVVRKTAYEDPKQHAGILVDDLAGGTALGDLASTASDGCSQQTFLDLPQADIIWVMDESSSMDDNRKDVVNNATSFFGRLVSAGVDFRIGVTGVTDPDGAYAHLRGKLCSVASTDLGHDGGPDRFLLPTEQKTFAACVLNPPGKVRGIEFGLANSYLAVKTHLPRLSGRPDRVRPGAKLVVILSTDELPNSLYSQVHFPQANDCHLDVTHKARLESALQPYYALFTGAGDAQAKLVYHVIGGVCGNACGADVAHGYREVASRTGGQLGDVCQKDLGPTLQLIVDEIVGNASPITLKSIPVAATLAVSLDGKSVLRSRSAGFDYNVTNNAIVFYGVKYVRGSKVTVGYRSWN